MAPNKPYNLRSAQKKVVVEKNNTTPNRQLLK